MRDRADRPATVRAPPLVPGCRRAASGCAPWAGPWRRVRDRKSTRLNSSHLGISYAVFCLKKKITIGFTTDALNLAPYADLVSGDIVGPIYEHSTDLQQQLVKNKLYEYVITFFFFNDTATTEIYTLSLHDALPI